MWPPQRALLAPAGWILVRYVDYRYYRVTKYKTRLSQRTGSPGGSAEGERKAYWFSGTGIWHTFGSHTHLPPTLHVCDDPACSYAVHLGTCSSSYVCSKAVRCN